MTTKNNIIIILGFIIFVTCLYFFLSGHLTDNNTLTSPVNNTNQNQEPIQNQQDNTEQIYISC